MKLSAIIPGVGTVTRTTDKKYTHVVYCPSFRAGEGKEETSYTSQISWASSLELAEKAASQMGYHRVFVPMRRKWKRAAAQSVKPIIVPVVT